MTNIDDIDYEKLQDYTLALLFLTSFRENKHYPWRTWKGHDWDVMNMLHENGYIGNPKSKAKSVVFTDEGFERSKELFEKFFSKSKEKDNKS